MNVSRVELKATNALKENVQVNRTTGTSTSRHYLPDYGGGTLGPL